MFKRILFAHNATPASERALPYVEHLARVEEADVVVLHVYQPPDQYRAVSGYDNVVSALEGLAHEVVEDTVEYLQAAGLHVSGKVGSGAPARVILEIAHELDATLIVLGTRGPSSVKDLILGDVTTEVLRYARCPVILVP
ncbi:MAG: universal stress protein [Anaerolineae bacterium]|nr:universal stress protein [Anaerolineae bacterium]